MSLRLIALAAACSLAAACGGDGSLPASTQPLPQTSGSFAGTYEVPTSPALAAAATFDVARVHWTVTDGVARIDYDLPEGLVGGNLSIELAGPVTTGDTALVLTSGLGTGTCTASGTIVTCHEELADLGTLPISIDVVQQDAVKEYAGPVADRVAVANVFSSDPIGNVAFDLSAPADGGGGGDGN